MQNEPYWKIARRMLHQANIISNRKYTREYRYRALNHLKNDLITCAMDRNLSHFTKIYRDTTPGNITNLGYDTGAVSKFISTFYREYKQPTFKHSMKPQYWEIGPHLTFYYDKLKSFTKPNRQRNLTYMGKIETILEDCVADPDLQILTRYYAHTFNPNNYGIKYSQPDIDKFIQAVTDQYPKPYAICQPMLKYTLHQVHIILDKKASLHQQIQAVDNLRDQLTDWAVNPKFNHITRMYRYTEPTNYMTIGNNHNIGYNFYALIEFMQLLHDLIQSDKDTQIKRLLAQ